MAKISPVSIKYMVYAKFEVIGPVEKPDVIGALFGQTEGLLGRELEIRELQKEGKIGRIEVETESFNGRTKGTIQIPTALDRSETSLIAAAIETIDRVGPTEATISVEKIEDVRGNKRDFILDRAKKLLEGMDGGSSKEISESLKIASRTSRIQEYGDEKLPAGDLSGKEIIVVEGRADVVNLLENRIENVVGMNGTKLPDTIHELGKEKELTLFLDGDRGGKLIASNVIDNARIKFVTFAPDGKEVEELNGKEIWASLRKKVPVKEFSSSGKPVEEKIEEKIREVTEEVKEESEGREVDRNALIRIAKDVEGTKKTFFYDSDLNVVKRVANTRVARELGRVKGVVAIAIDGTSTPNIVRAAESVGVKYIAAKNFSDASAQGIEFLSF